MPNERPAVEAWWTGDDRRHSAAIADAVDTRLEQAAQTALAAAENPELLLAEHRRELLRALENAIIDLELAARALSPARDQTPARPARPAPRRHLRLLPSSA